MKTCPKCNRTFPDEGQKFCTFDGGLLIAPQPFDPNATIRATSIDLNAASERPTSRDLPDPNATIIDTSATVALPRNTGPTGMPTRGPDTADIALPTPQPPPPQPVSPQPPPPPPPPPAVAQQTSAPLTPPAVQTPATSMPLPPPPTAAKKKSKLPLIIGGLLLLLLLGGGALAGLVFFVVKPMLDQRAAEQKPNTDRQVVTPTPETPSPVPTVEEQAPTPEFIPPPNTVQFQNSNANLDGKLAEHYFDFSFYYPKSWQLDPKAGVPGAANFVKVERSLPPNFPQENFVVGWYTSTGTFVGDLQNFPQRVKEFSASLAKAFPEYRLISEGPTKVNSMQGYEFRWEGLSTGTDKGDIHLWGRVIFLPTGNEGDTSGATLAMLSTSLAPELSSVDDVGEKGQAPVILDSFRFGKK